MQQGSRIRHRFQTEIDPGKAAHGLAVIECVFESFIRQRIPLLEKVNAEHPLQADRRSPTLAFSTSLPNNEHVFDDKSCRQGWDDDACSDLQTGNEETLSAGGRVVFAGAGDSLDEPQHAEAPQGAPDLGGFPAG